MAQIATGNNDDALDIVQDSMMKLVQTYSDRDISELGPLFHRILQNRITDWHRRGTLSQRIFRWWRQSGSHDNKGAHYDAPWDNIDAGNNPQQQLERDREQALLLNALHQLPHRQQQAFLLRGWEGLDVKQTAEVMGCSEGSVKTHYSRAMNVLKQHLED